MPVAPDVDFLSFDRPAPLDPGTVELSFSIKHQHDAGSSPAGLTRTATYRCNGDDGAIAHDWLQGVGLFALPGGFPNPKQYPGNPELRVKNVRLTYEVNERPSPQGLSAEDAILVTQYETNRLDITGFRTADLFEVAYPIPWSRVESHDTFEQYRVKGVSVTVDREFQRRVSITEYSIERGMISDWLGFREILKTFKNTLNMYTFMGAAPGTLYFAGFSWKPEYDASGFPVQTFRITLREREADWNFVPSDDSMSEWVDYHDFSTPPNRNYVYKDWTPIHSFGII